MYSGHTRLCFPRYLLHAVRLLNGKFYIQSADWLVNCGTRKPEINISLSVAVASVSICMLGSLFADVSYFFFARPFSACKEGNRRRLSAGYPVYRLANVLSIN